MILLQVFNPVTPQYPHILGVAHTFESPVWANQYPPGFNE